VAEIDPDGQWLTIAEQPIGEVINHNGVTQRRRVLNGRVVDEPDARDGWSNRGTFAGDAEAFMAAKRAGIASEIHPSPSKPLGSCSKRRGPD
jgi:hypothetical protein